MEILDTASSDENRISFEESEVKVVQDALKTKLFLAQEDVEIRVAKFTHLVKALSEKFGIPEVGVELADNRERAFGHYNVERNVIVINKRFSLTTTLWSFAAALAHARPEIAGTQLPDEGGFRRSGFTPSGFSKSLFKAAAPIMYEEAKRAGRLMNVDVPYTDGGAITAERNAALERGEDCDGCSCGNCSGSSSEDDADVDPENRDTPPETPPSGPTPHVPDPENGGDN